jgi:hypothetical protein
MNPGASEPVNKEAIETLSLGTHERTGEKSPVLGTPTEVMQHIGELTIWPEYPKDIILAGGWSSDYRTRTVERMEIGEEGMILNSQFLPESSFTNIGYSAVTLGTIGTDESKGLLIGGSFRMVENGKWEYQKTIEFELSTKNWDINNPATKHGRYYSSSSILPDGSPAICGGNGISAIKSTEIRGEDGEWNLSKTAILRLGRYRHGTTVVNGSMFAIGGHVEIPTQWPGGVEIIFMSSVEMWDPRDKSGWNDSLVSSMTWKRGAHSVSSVDDTIFVFGGRSSYGPFWLCESLDIRSNKWKTISSIPLLRSSHSSVVIGDHILIIGGFPGTTQIDSYDPVTNTWTTLQHRLLQSRYEFQAFAL